MKRVIIEVSRPGRDESTNFDSNDFAVTESPPGVINVALARWNPHRRIYKACHSDASGTTMSTIGMPAVTLTAPGGLQSRDTGAGSFVGLSSGATNGNVASVVLPSAATVRFDWEFDIEFQFVSSVLTNARLWVGLFASDPSASDNPSGVAFAGFRCSSAIGDTAWKIVTNDGSGTGTVVNTGVAVTDTTAYRMRIAAVGSSFRFWINDVLVGTVSTDIPAGSTVLTPRALVTTLAAVNREMRVGRVSILHER